MDLQQVKEWLLVISGSATLLSIAVSVWVGVQQYRLKLKAEERLAKSTQAETDLRLLSAFSELVQVASGTGAFRVSENLIKYLIDSGHVTSADFDNPAAFRNKLQPAMLSELVGVTHSRMASFAIGALARRYDFLRELGIRALEAKSVRENDPERIDMLIRDLEKM